MEKRTGCRGGALSKTTVVLSPCEVRGMADRRRGIRRDDDQPRGFAPVYECMGQREQMRLSYTGQSETQEERLRRLKGGATGAKNQEMGNSMQHAHAEIKYRRRT